ncbi:hypothetical protein EVAR_54981_1 [Eumeta japonica]|uniref:Uncharacterized protein n=1 Tax=Eumeta variegata TaxID=151549 RepID=A0A4C1Z0X3_EUMVA|nr:hypothetical protein EVAR_54981_1 [Eumeta japonica]
MSNRTSIKNSRKNHSGLEPRLELYVIHFNQASSSSTSRSASRNGKRKRKSSSNEDDNENFNSGSDNTVVASSNKGSKSDGSNSKENFTLVQGKKVIKKARAPRRRAASKETGAIAGYTRAKGDNHKRHPPEARNGYKRS